jgi:DNA-binding transcriptional regulator PaaX
MLLSFTERMLMEIADFLDLFEPRTMKDVLYPDFYKTKKEFYKRLTKRWERKRVANNFYEFKRMGYVKIKNYDGQKMFSITPKGYSKILQIKLKLKKKKQKIDGKFRIVIFDVSEKERLKREFFRGALKSFGFKQLQKSVWYSPYDVFKELGFFVKDCRLEKNVKFILATKIQEKF